ncbi:MAG: class I SAM-dependent rRNA methyltransferase [Pirellulales bacterium]
MTSDFGDRERPRRPGRRPPQRSGEGRRWEKQRPPESAGSAPRSGEPRRSAPLLELPGASSAVSPNLVRGLERPAELAEVHLATPTSHPLIYRKRIVRVEGAPRAGDLVTVYFADRELLGYGLYNPKSEIAVRMLQWNGEPPDETFWETRLTEAVQLRRDMLRLDSVADSYRLVHAEADGLSGLVVDKLGDTLSAEVFSLAMWQRAEEIVGRLARRCGLSHWTIRPAPYTLAQEGFLAEPRSSPGFPERVTIQEFGTRFRVRFAGGHKTGFFCDQRDNRRLLAGYCTDRQVLDLCCYSGGFAIQAKCLGRAAEVTAVDLDEQPLALARENANLNQARVHFVQADAFAYMRDMLRLQRQYDVVVLDPPKLITSRQELEEGTQKHFDLNRLAMQLVRPGGLLLSCSCAGLLPEEEFLQLLYAAARQAGPLLPGQTTPQGRPKHAARIMQILARTGAAADHPVVAHCPETAYLKAVWMRLL